MAALAAVVAVLGAIALYLYLPRNEDGLTSDERKALSAPPPAPEGTPAPTPRNAPQQQEPSPEDRPPTPA